MKSKTILKLAMSALAASTLGTAYGADRLPRDVGPVSNPAYQKQCGGCHFAYQPGWLPERSWKQVMATLDNHYGKSVSLASAERDALSGYLAANAADRMLNLRSVQVMASMRGVAPTEVSKTPYIAGIHGGLLDPAFRSAPKADSLANCTTCHTRAAEGSFGAVQYTVSDETFRGRDGPDYRAVLTAEEQAQLSTRK